MSSLFEETFTCFLWKSSKQIYDYSTSSDEKKSVREIRHTLQRFNRLNCLCFILSLHNNLNEKLKRWQTGNSPYQSWYFHTQNESIMLLFMTSSGHHEIVCWGKLMHMIMNLIPDQSVNSVNLNPLCRFIFLQPFVPFFNRPFKYGIQHLHSLVTLTSQFSFHFLRKMFIF